MPYKTLFISLIWTCAHVSHAQNQVSHAARHVIDRGVHSVELVQATIRRDLASFNLEVGAFHKGVTTIQGIKYQYHVFKLPNGVMNVGTIIPLN